MKKRAARLSKDETVRLVQECRTGANSPREEKRRVEKVFEGMVGKYGLTINDVSIKAIFESICDPDREGILESGDSQLVAEAVVSTAFPTVFNKLIYPTVIDEYNIELGDVMKLVTEIDGQNLPKNRIPIFVGYDDMDKVLENEKYPEDVLPERFTEIKTHKVGKIISLTLEFLVGDQTALISKKAQDVGRTMAATQAKFVTQKTFGLACELTAEGATGNLNVDGTAVTQFADTHATVDGQVNDNVVTTPFSTAALNELRVLAKAATDPRGNKIVVNPKQLVFPPTLWQVVNQALRSPMEYGSANNAINPFLNQYELIELVHLTSTTQYFLGDHPRQTWFLWDWRPRMETQGNNSEQAFERDVVSRHKISAKFGCGLTDYRFSYRGGA